jgi:hypothetical protein
METCAAGNPLEPWWDDTNAASMVNYATYWLGHGQIAVNLGSVFDDARV